MGETTQIHVEEKTQSTCPLGVGEWYLQRGTPGLKDKDTSLEVEPVAKPTVLIFTEWSKFSEGITQT